LNEFWSGRSTSKFPLEYCKSTAFPAVDNGEDESIFKVIMLFLGAVWIVCRFEDETETEAGLEFVVQLSIIVPNIDGIATIVAP
jgi:hypothetical protein